jgi:regulatory protein
VPDRPDGSLAPVTYLFGAPPPGGVRAAASAASPPQAEPKAESEPQAGAEPEAEWELQAEPETETEPATATWAVATGGTFGGVEPAEWDPDETEPNEDAPVGDAAGWAIPGAFSGAPSPYSDAPDPYSPPSRAEKRARNVSVAALARRGVSVAEMRDLLVKRELEQTAVDEEVATLERVGLLDDAALAETLVRTLVERKALGRTAIAAELRRRRIDETLAAVALDAVDPEQEDDRALEVARARARQLGGLDPQTAERRLAAYLMRRGYGGAVVSRVSRLALSELQSRRGPRFE